MIRTPEPKEQARLLVKLLAEAGLQLGHQASLNVVAQLQGHRNWNVLEASAAKQSKQVVPEKRKPEMPEGFDQLLDAAADVVSNADDAGCDGDLTVTSASAVERLDQLITKFHREGIFARSAQHGFTADDVLTIRPDLLREEAEAVVHIADKEFDSEVGVNWDVLGSHADWHFPRRFVQAKLEDCKTGATLATVVVDYSHGTLYAGSFDEIAAMDPSLRHQRRLTHTSYDYDDVAVYLGDGTFVDLVDTGPELFGGDTDALHNSLMELLKKERTPGELVRTMRS